MLFSSEGEETIMPIYERRYVKLLMLVALAVSPLIFYWGFRIGSFTVDDPGLISYLSDGKRSFWDKVFNNISSSRWRPLSEFHYLLGWAINGKDYSSWMIYSSFFLGVTGIAFFGTLQVAGVASHFAFGFSLLLITSRFSQYQVVTSTGLMESLGLLLFILLVLSLVVAIRDPSRSAHRWTPIVFLSLVLTHERFQVLVLPLLFFFLYVTKWEKRDQRVIYAISVVSIPIFLFVIKQLILDLPALVGVGSSTKLGFTSEGFLQHSAQAVLQLVGLNVGEPYLVGLNTPSQNGSTQSVGLVSVVFLVAAISIGLYCIYRSSPQTRGGSGRSVSVAGVMVCGILGVASLVVGSSVTQRLELRWLSTPYVLVLFLGAFTLDRWNRAGRNLNLAPIVIFISLISSSLLMNFKYRDAMDGIFFRSGQYSVRQSLDTLIPAFEEAIREKLALVVVDPLGRAEMAASLVLLVKSHSDVPVPHLIEVARLSEVLSMGDQAVVVLVKEDGSLERTSGKQLSEIG
jgi:hypothetical protein